MYRNSNEWQAVYESKNALWIHDGNPKRPHALLTSGNHSNGFFNSRLIIPDEILLREAASDLLELYVTDGETITAIEGVMGPQTGATRLAQFIKEQIISQYHAASCFSVSPAKDETDGKKSMIFTQKEIDLLLNKKMVPCEDVLTTGTSVELAVSAITNAGGMLVPYVLVLVNRSGLKEVNGKKILALIDRAMPIWKPEECPLCKEGSEAVRPKDNWALLNAVY